MLGPFKALEIPGFIGCLDFSVYLNFRFYNIQSCPSCLMMNALCQYEFFNWFCFLELVLHHIISVSHACSSC